MDKRILPSPELLRQLLVYEPETGKLYWKERPRDMFTSDHACKSWNAKLAGKEAFTTYMEGYRKGKIFGIDHLAHRVAWAIHCGKWPKDQVDHVNLTRDDNRASNLREAGVAQNMMNTAKLSKNTSGHKGVSWHSRANKWVAMIGLNGRSVYLGVYSDIKDARDAYRRAADKHFGEFANYG